MKFILLSLVSLLSPLMAAEEIPLVPTTEKELKAWMEGTKWYSEAGGKVPITFAGGKFETPLHKGSYTVDKPRVIILNWGKGTKIRCVLDEQCTKMTELDGEKNVFHFDGRKPAEETKPSRLPAKPEKKAN
jgi:hypothetical protein